MTKYKVDAKQIISFEVEKLEENWDLGLIEARDIALEKMRKLELLDGWGGTYCYYDDERLNYNRVRVTFIAPLAERDRLEDESLQDDPGAAGVGL